MRQNAAAYTKMKKKNLTKKKKTLLTYHNWGAILLEMIQQFRSFRGHLPGTDVQHLASHIQQSFQDKTNFGGADPLFRIHETGRLVADIDETLLDFLEGRHLFVCVTLQDEPGGERLEGAISATPALVVHVVLAVVVVPVFALD